MDFAETPEQAALRRRVREALADPLVRRALRTVLEAGEGEPDARALYAALGAHGMLAVDWPVDYGGQGMGKVEAMIVAEELAEHGVPDTLHVNSVQIVGGFLLTAASDEQKARWLPDLAAGRRFASVLFSERDAGSDLGALTTTATFEDGHYRLDGEKLYSLKTRLVDYGLCAALTDPTAPRYQGLSLFLLPLALPGVRVRTLASVPDEQFHAVALDGVRVGAECMVGEPGAGWSLIERVLTIERTGLDYSTRGRAWYRRVMAALAAAPEGVHGAALERAGRHGVALEGSRLLVRSAVSRLAAGEIDPALSATAKWQASESARAVAWWAVEELGDAALLAPEAAGVRSFEAVYREAPGLTLSAGTSEMMLQLMATGVSSEAGVDRGEDLVQRRLRAVVRERLGDPPPPDPDEVWKRLAGAGVPALALPVDAGGVDLGQGALVAVMEELGRVLASSPLLDTLFAADCLAALGPGGARWPALEGIAVGGDSAAVVGAYREPPGSGFLRLDGDALTGDAGAVPSSGDATWLLVGATDRLGWQLLLLPGDHRGLEWQSCRDLSGGERHQLRFRALRVGTQDWLAGGDQAAGIRHLALARTRIRQAAYLVGLAERALELTLARVRARRQFGVPLSSFQSPSFRLAALRGRLRAARLLVHHAAWTDDTGGDAMAPATDALCSAADLALAATREGMQLHGAQGLLESSQIQRCYRRAALEAARLGPVNALWKQAGHLRLARTEGKGSR